MPPGGFEPSARTPGAPARPAHLTPRATEPFFNRPGRRRRVDLLVCSLEDQASVTLRDAVLERLTWEPVPGVDGAHRCADAAADTDAAAAGDGLWLYTIDDLHLEHDDVDRDAAADLDVDGGFDRVLFLSRHVSEANIPSLTVHPIGNFGPAPFGGREGALVPAPTDFLAPMLRALAARAPDRYEATLEATHHGPHLRTPACFVEVGSDEKAWNDPEAADALVGALLQARASPAKGPVVVGVGGGHYVPRMTDIARTRHVRLGHMLPDYHMEDGVDPGYVDRLVEATPGAEAAYLDRHRLGKRLIVEVQAMLEKRGIKVVRGGDLERVEG